MDSHHPYSRKSSSWLVLLNDCDYNYLSYMQMMIGIVHLFFSSHSYCMEGMEDAQFYWTQCSCNLMIYGIYTHLSLNYAPYGIADIILSWSHSLQLCDECQRIGTFINLTFINLTIFILHNIMHDTACLQLSWIQTVHHCSCRQFI